MLKFTKTPVYIPDPARPKPAISEAHKKQAQETPPQPVPFHCKPWVDGQTIGWSLFYGYLTPITIVGLENGRIAVQNGEELARETQQPRTIDQFAPGHFGISTGYTFKTPAGYGLLFIPAGRPLPHLDLLTGFVETDWYPRPIFLVYQSPPAGAKIELSYKTEIGRVVVAPYPSHQMAEPMSEAELAELHAQEQKYLAEEASTPGRWSAATGDEFTHLYKQWSQQKKSGIY